ncbi:uncharacterized protein LOC130613839 [Hydractinia symbiolongicarpus]|uniref:uncharacterized protein LOC130613839 n=1 Tax=Hydractinia symbiolongicarpus TaxID=13093 RepID=UPI00254D2BB7|nr:uncharacterized protein LOC130613839 [Hydractinia symbiolongicarpus]
MVDYDTSEILSLQDVFPDIEVFFSPKKRRHTTSKSTSQYEPLPKQKKLKHPYTGRVGSTAEMMRQYYRARISLTEIEQSKANDPRKRKEESFPPTSSELTVAEEVEVVTTERTHDLADTVHDDTLDQGGDDNEVSIIDEILHPDLPPRPYNGVLDDTMRKEVMNGERLTHATINFAQSILKKQSGVDGFEDTGLSYTCHSRFPNQFVQIFFIKERNHWVTGKRKSQDEIYLYDSLSVYNKELERNTLKKIARMMYCHDDAIKITNASVQQQENDIDCGLFAIAFAVEESFGRSPQSISFDTKQMRPHLLKCLESATFTFSQNQQRENVSVDLLRRHIRFTAYVEIFSLIEMLKKIKICSWPCAVNAKNGFIVAVRKFQQKFLLATMSIKNGDAWHVRTDISFSCTYIF